MKNNVLILLLCCLWLWLVPLCVGRRSAGVPLWLGAGEAEIKAYMGESHRFYEDGDVHYAMPQGEQEWGRSMGNFRHSQYKYIESMFGWPAETSYNFFQGRLYTKAIVLDADGVSLAEARELAAKLEAAIQKIVPNAEKRRHTMDLPLWGAVPENLP